MDKFQLVVDLWREEFGADYPFTHEQYEFLIEVEGLLDKVAEGLQKLAAE